MRSARKATVLLLSLLALVAGGCRKRSAQAAPVVIFPAPPERVEVPVVVEKPAETAPTETKPAETSKPEPEPAASPAKRPASRPGASKPAPQPETPPPTESATPKPPPPRITPGLSPQEQARLQQETLDAISLSEKNLKLADGRNLNSTQRDLAEKVRGFLAQAQEARNEGDWARARNLADKARVLSNELVNSL
jgi:hypothetical protein